MWHMIQYIFYNIIWRASSSPGQLFLSYSICLNPVNEPLLQFLSRHCKTVLRGLAPNPNSDKLSISPSFFLPSFRIFPDSTL